MVFLLPESVSESRGMSEKRFQSSLHIQIPITLTITIAPGVASDCAGSSSYLLQFS